MISAVSSFVMGDGGGGAGGVGGGWRFGMGRAGADISQFAHGGYGS